jgi:nicotinamidase-related amidase
MSAVVRTGRLVPATTHFFLCDVQEKFRKTIYHFDKIVPVCNRLIAAGRTLGIPVTVTEQYPKALGKTVSELDISGCTYFPKTDFTMIIPEVEAELAKNAELKSVVLFGLETHVCIQQTCLDLLDKGFDVHIVADGVSSRTQTDRMIAIERMRSSGAFITTHEAILFELLRRSTHPNFKPVSSLIRDLLPGSELVPPGATIKKGFF